MHSPPARCPQRRPGGAPRLAGLLVLCCLLVQSACTNLIFQPTRIRYRDPGSLGIATEDLYLASSDGVVLHGWRLPAAGPARGSIVFLHGNAENISSHIGGVHWLPAHGYEVFLFDYRGYGRSGGSAELDGVMHDAGRMIDYARTHATVAGRGLTVMGQSLGGSIAISALARLPDRSGINGLIAISAFSDYRQITRDALASHWLTRALRWPLSLTVSNRYRPADAIGALSPLPVFLLYSEADEIVSAAHARQLYEAAAPPRFLVELQGGHNRMLALPENHERLLQILDLLNRPLLTAYRRDAHAATAARSGRAAGPALREATRR